MTPKIHTYVSQEPLVRPNAFIVEGEHELVLVDTTLTQSDSKALKRQIDALGKPLAGILITHGHPDHVAGAANISPNGEVPIYSLRSIYDLMRASEQHKHEQWSALFKEEWIPKWVYPNHFVNHGDTIELAGLTFRALDLGAGGDCDANAIYLLDDGKAAAFVGDFIYRNHHTYMMDGSVLRWIANLRRFEPLLSEYKTLYLGHGEPAGASAINDQIVYLESASAMLLEATGGSAILDETSSKRYHEMMSARYPDYGFSMTVDYSAPALAKELVGLKNYDW